MTLTRRRFCVGALGVLLVGCGGPSLGPSATAPPTSASTSASGASATTTVPLSSAPPLSPTPSPRLNIVTTVAPITNIVRNVAGDLINLTGIVPEGEDSHTFEPAPQDARSLAAADLVIVNGLHLEDPTVKLAEANKKPGRELLLLGDKTITRQEWLFDFSFPEDQGDPNPHLWMNVAYAMKYAELSRDALITLDGRNREAYQRRATAYLARLEGLDTAIMAAIKTIPEKNRRLLTYHDSWAYFAKRYGLTVIGAIQPADFGEPSAREVISIINQLKQEQVPAIFGSEVFASKVLEQIGRETGVKYIDALRDDDLPGSPDAPEHTYIGMMLENVRIITESLGGNAAALNGIDPKNIA